MVQFKKDLESICSIFSWNPTGHQLESLRNEINLLLKQGKAFDKNALHRLIEKHCPGAVTLSTKGIDNSDLNALLTIAINRSK